MPAGASRGATSRDSSTRDKRHTTEKGSNPDKTLRNQDSTSDFGQITHDDSLGHDFVEVEDLSTKPLKKNAPTHTGMVF